MDSSLDRYRRQFRFPELGEAGQRELARKRVTICGCGALGTVSASALARAGVGGIRIVDRDFLELANLQRQVLFDEQDLADDLPKAEAAARKLRRVNSRIDIDGVVTDLDHTNIDRLCGDADVILDGTDNFETRLLINDFAWKTDIPWVYGGALGSEGHCMTIVPGRTACLRCLVESAPPPGTTPTCETAGILAPISTIIASFQVAEAIKILSGNLEKINPGLLVVDVWNNTVRRLNLDELKKRSDCPACKLGRFDYLAGKAGSHTTTLCGRNSVQVVPLARGPIELDALRERLSDLGEVTCNRFLLRFRVEGYEFSVFPDGRAIIKGTDDVAMARSLYARYLGS